MTPEEVLEQAAEKIAEHGWVQNQYATNEGYCALGAMRVAVTGRQFMTGLTEEQDELYDAAQNLLGRQTGVFNIPAWNDAKDRTAEDVILSMKKAAHHG